MDCTPPFEPAAPQGPMPAAARPNPQATPFVPPYATQEFYTQSFPYGMGHQTPDTSSRPAVHQDARSFGPYQHSCMSNPTQTPIYGSVDTHQRPSAGQRLPFRPISMPMGGHRNMYHYHDSVGHYLSQVSSASAYPGIMPPQYFDAYMSTNGVFDTPQFPPGRQTQHSRSISMPIEGQVNYFPSGASSASTYPGPMPSPYNYSQDLYTWPTNGEFNAVHPSTPHFQS